MALLGLSKHEGGRGIYRLPSVLNRVLQGSHLSRRWPDKGSRAQVAFSSGPRLVARGLERPHQNTPTTTTTTPLFNVQHHTSLLLPSFLPFFLSIQTLSCCCCYGCPCHSHRCCWRPPPSSSSRTTCGVADGRQEPSTSPSRQPGRPTATSARPTRRTIQFDLVCVCHEATRRYKREDCPD